MQISHYASSLSRYSAIQIYFQYYISGNRLSLPRCKKNTKRIIPDGHQAHTWRWAGPHPAMGKGTLDEGQERISLATYVSGEVMNVQK